jgi:hypothetical protein
LTCFGSIPHRIQAGPIQSRAGTPIITVLRRQIMTLGSDPFTQRLKLRANGAACLLRLGRHSSVNGNSHRALRSAAAVSVTALKINS